MNTAAGLSLCVLCAALVARGAEPEVRVINFAEGKWDRAAWTSLRTLGQDEPRVLAQNADSIGTTEATFRKDDYSKERDNAILITDTGTIEGQIEVTFTMGTGFNKTSSPGVVISPVVADGVMEKGISVFVAPYAVVAWLQEADHEKNRMRPTHMAQITRWTDPEARHVLRCRYSAKQKAVAIQVDDSDVLVFRFLGHKTLSRFAADINSTIGVWGCHGTCAFYEVKILKEGTLPFEVRSKPEKQEKAK